MTPKPATEETMAVHDCGTCTCLPEPLRVPMQTLDVIGLTDDEMDPTDAIQFGVRVPHPDLGHITHVYGDQSWVAYGKCIEDGTYPDGQIVYRTITIAYGEWQSA